MFLVQTFSRFIIPKETQIRADLSILVSLIAYLPFQMAVHKKVNFLGKQALFLYKGGCFKEGFF